MRLAEFHRRHLRASEISRAGFRPISQIVGCAAGRTTCARRRTVHAAEWHIDPNRVGVLGFSAGGHLAAALSTHYDQRLYDGVDAADQLSCRPDFAVIIYPGYLALSEQNFAPNPDIHVTEKTPPSILVQAEDDPVHVENSTVYYQALKNAKVPAEMHLYAQGGHGYGLRRTALPVTNWPASVETWLHTIQVLPSVK